MSDKADLVRDDELQNEFEQQHVQHPSAPAYQLPVYQPPAPPYPLPFPPSSSPPATVITVDDSRSTYYKLRLAVAIFFAIKFIVIVVVVIILIS